MHKNKRHELDDKRVIDMTPMIDVVFQLILFFMLTSSLVRPNQIELDLPESTSATKAQEQPALVVSYGQLEGKPVVLLNKEPVEDGLKGLGPAMLAKSDPASKPRVDVLIGEKIPYAEFIDVIDAVRDAGFPKFSLLTKPPSLRPVNGTP